jgi:hypothetical protein
MIRLASTVFQRVPGGYRGDMDDLPACKYFHGRMALL